MTDLKSPLEVAEHIQEAFKRYYDTQFWVKSPEIRRERKKLLHEHKALYSEPLIELVHPYPASVDSVKVCNSLELSKDFAENLLQKEGFDGKNILNEDLLYIKTLENNSQDCIALLSVIPHVPLNKIEKIHKELYRVLKPGGKLVIAYRNELFDLFTFNSITLEFYKNRIWELDELKKLSETPEVLKALSGLINNPDLPGKFHTNAKDKSFGKLNRFKTNPLTIKEYLSSYGLKWLESHFYHFHAVPPLISNEVQDLKKINHHLELNYSSDWRANFMCPMYLVISEK